MKKHGRRKFGKKLVIRMMMIFALIISCFTLFLFLKLDSPSNQVTKRKTSTLRRYDESEDDADMLKEWEDLDGDDVSHSIPDLASLKTGSWRCLPDILRMSHTENEEKAQDAAFLLTDSGEKKRFRAWSSCFNQCERSVAPVWDLFTKDYNKDFETCHCACYEVSSISDSVARREVLSNDENVKRHIERILLFASKAYSEEMKSRQHSNADTTWTLTDSDPCDVGYALISRRTFWAGGCSWGKNRCGRRVHPGWVAAGLSRGLEPLSHGLRLYADFVRDYLTPTSSLSSLKLLTRTPNADESLVLHLGGIDSDEEIKETKLLDIKATAAGVRKCHDTPRITRENTMRTSN